MNEKKIFEIYELINCNNSLEKQKIGIKNASKISNLNYFIQPITEFYSKNIWENCAIIVFNREDDEIKKYIKPLLEWLQDMCWPGSDIILNRLKKIKYEDIENDIINIIEQATINNEWQWIENIAKINMENTTIKRYYDIAVKNNEELEKEYIKKRNAIDKKLISIIQIPKIINELQNNKNVLNNLKNISSFYDPIFVNLLEKMKFNFNDNIKKYISEYLSKIYNLYGESINYYDESFELDFIKYLNYINEDILKNSAEQVFKYGDMKYLIYPLSSNSNVAVILRILNLFNENIYSVYFNEYMNDNNQLNRVVAQIGLKNIK